MIISQISEISNKWKFGYGKSTYSTQSARKPINKQKSLFSNHYIYNPQYSWL